MLKEIQLMTTRIVISSKMLGIGALLLASSTTHALTFTLPPNGNIIGNIQYASVAPGDSLATIAMRYNMGGYEMVEANPGVNYENPKTGARLVVPSRFVLPDTPRQGIVINLAEMRLYYFHPDGVHVSTYPVGVGQEGWNTPLGKTTITTKRENPTWIVPDSIYNNYIEHGKEVQKVNPPSPTNPLGKFAMNIGFKSIVIHGTPYPKAVGVRSSHGCIRMTNENVGELFRQVKIGTPVNIVHQTTKIGKMDNKLYLEAHVPISSEMYHADHPDVGGMVHKLVQGGKYQIEWQEVEKLRSKASGIPLPIGSIY